MQVVFSVKVLESICSYFTSNIFLCILYLNLGLLVA
jgi:hypothetical protein